MNDVAAGSVWGCRDVIKDNGNEIIDHRNRK